MVLLGINLEFVASHGSRKVCNDKYSIEILIEGKIKNGFVAGIDHVKIKEELARVVNKLDGKYLDDIVGRATNENIVQYLMFNLKGLPFKSIKVSEGHEAFVLMSKDEFNEKSYPAQLLFNKGHSLLLREKPRKAIKYFSEAIAQNPKFAEAYNLRGRCFKYLKDYESAFKDFLSALEIKKDFGEAWRNLGNAYLYLGRYEKMIPAFNKAVKLIPSSALAINNRGYGYFLIGKYDLALKDHQKAIDIEPNYAEAHYDKGMALKALGKKKKAREAFTISKKLKHLGKDTYHNIRMY